MTTTPPHIETPHPVNGIPEAEREQVQHQTSWAVGDAADSTEILAIQQYTPARTLQILFWVIVALLVGAVTWAAVSPVNISIHAPGMIRPATDLQVFRSPFNALLDSLYVSDNLFVEKGDTLAVFDAGEFTAQRSLNLLEQKHIMGEVGDLKRLLALLPSQPEPGNVGDRMSASPSFSLQKYFTEYALIRKDLQILADHYSLLKSKSERTAQLLKKNFSSTEEYESASTEAHLQELKIAQYVQDKEKQFNAHLFELEQQLSNLRKEAQTIAERIGKCYLVANVSGAINGLKIQKAGVFCTAGQELFAISPEQELHAEVYVNPRDAGLLAENLPVSYYIEAFSYNDWEIVHGRVRSISRDITLDESTGRPYYKVICTFDRQALRYKKGKGSTLAVALKKGLPVQANIIVGRKKMLEMLYDRTVDFLRFD